MKTAALYMRVSSVDQHPETQLYDLRAMAQQRGFRIVTEYTDKISGTKARRPGLDDLLRDARRGRFQVVLVWASDRIARSVRHFLEVLDELNHLSIEFVSFRENLDTGGPLGRAVVIIIGAIAELERNLIVERETCQLSCIKRCGFKDTWAIRQVKQERDNAYVTHSGQLIEYARAVMCRIPKI